MKKTSRLIASILIGLFAVATFGTIAVNHNNNNANQALASEGSYYNSVTSDMSGTTLLNQLHTIVNSGTISVSYDWSRYEDADEDPNNSNNVILIYARNSVAKSAHVSGNTGWNREHTFPQSKMESSAAKSDNHIIFASDNKVNGKRGNLPMGVVDGGTVVQDYFGNNTTCRYDGSHFDPHNVARGIVARSTMYAAAMYSFDVEDNFESIATMLQWHLEYPVDSFDTGRNEKVYANQGNRNPFVDHPEYACRIWGSTNSTTKSICGISDTGITSISKTSATIAQGSSTTISATSSNSGTISWSSSNTSVATVSSGTAASGSNITITGVSAGSATITASITISGQTYTKTCAVTVTAPKNLSSISISGQKTSFTVGASFSFGGTVTAHYSDSTTANVTNSATFSGYNMNTEGQQTVTVSYTEGNTTKTTTYTITVNASGGGGSGSQRIVSNSGSTYYETGSIVFSGSGSSATASCDAFSVSWLKNSGTNDIALSYAEMRIYSGHSFTITPNEDYTITSVVITANSNSYASAVGGSSLNNCTKSVNSSTVTLTPTNGENAVGFTNSAQSRLNYVIVNYDYESSGSSEPTLTSISLDTTNVTTTFTVGNTFTYAGLVVTAHYSDSSSQVVNSGYTVSTPDMSTTGNKTVTVTYSGLTANYQITVNQTTPTSITASVSKTYYVGETISSSDITVKDNNNNTVTGFSFANNNYQFTYEDASSGGSLTNKTFTNAVSYSNMTCSLTVQVQRKARVTPSTEDYSVTYTDLPTSYQTSTSERTAASGIKYIAYNLANYSSKMQFKASGGYFQTTQAMTLKTVTINNRETNALTVYGSTNGSSFSNAITGTSDVYDLTGYSYVKIMKNGSGAAYCSSITLTVGASDTAINLANYIMYEDTNNQCLTKLNTAISYLHDLSSTEKTTFKTSNDYVISTARERLEAWALNQGKTIDYTNGALTRSINPFIENIDSNSIYIIIIVGVAALSTIGCYFFLRRKEH